ncbi:MAG: cyclase family protein [Lachnospiraceae bacterium]|nr:cyclase family protein [Lachnospiraceae bacterium]
MKIYDIAQEVFSCAVYPGDPVPERFEILKKSDGAVCNLSGFQMCAHNGTHVDAPYHFIDGGDTIDEVPLEKFIGYAFVKEFAGDIGAEDAERILQEARAAEEASGKEGAATRILIKGKATLTEAAAKVMAQNKILLYGNESQTVGPEDAPLLSHMAMLSEKVVLLEGIRLGNVPEGVYFLNAAPLNLGYFDGSPCRAVLIEGM